MIKDIELCSIEELLDEIEKRFDNFVFCGRAPVEGTGERKTENTWMYKGDFLTNIGLTSFLGHRIQQDWDEAIGNEG